MRILHLNQFGTRIGGVESYIADVCSALAQEGHRSLLVYFSPTDAADLIPDTLYTSLPEWPHPPAEAVRVIEQAIATFRPDVAYIHAVYHPALIRWIARRLPTAAYVHGPYLVCPGSAQYLRTRSRVCPHKAGLVCLAHAQVERCCWGRNPLKHARLLRRVRAFVEAYAVATPTGGTPELLSDGHNGLSFEPEDAPGLAAQLQRLARDADLRCRLAQAGWQTVTERFTVSRMIDQLESYLVKVTALG